MKLVRGRFSMFISRSISEVNDEINRVYGIDINLTPIRRAYHIYTQYFTKVITLSEAAENIDGMLFDHGLIKKE